MYKIAELGTGLDAIDFLKSVFIAYVFWAYNRYKKLIFKRRAKILSKYYFIIS